MSLTFKLKMVFSVLCFFFKPASWHLLLYQYRSIHFDAHISKKHSPIKSRVFHVPLLYFEHLPLQRSLHGPAERETPDSHLNTADRKSCRGTEQSSHSFLLNYIMYINNDLGQINDFTLGDKLCIVHFSAKRLSFCDSNTVCMLHIESCNTDRTFSFRLLCFFKHQTSN